MADKKFAGINGSVNDAQVTQDYKSARCFDKLRVGNLGVYFRSGFKIRFIPYGEIERAFIRIHEVNGKLCCGSSVFQYFRMVFVRDGKEYADVISENEEEMDKALALIHERAPEISIGFEPKSEK